MGVAGGTSEIEEAKREREMWRRRRRRLLLLSLALLGFMGLNNWLPVELVPEGASVTSVRFGLALLFLGGVLWLTEALPLAVTALLIPVVATLGGGFQVKESFSQFAHPLIFLFLASFGIAAALSRQGIDRYVAGRVMTLGRGSFIPTALILFAVVALLSMWITNTAAVALMLPVALGVLRKAEESRGGQACQRATLFMLLGLAYAASIGGMGTLIGTPPNAIAGAQLDISFREWLRYGVPAVLVLLPLLAFLLWVLLRPRQVRGLKVDTEVFQFTGPRVATLVIFGLTIAGWLCSGMLSQMLGIKGGMDTVVALSGVILLVSGHLLNWSDINRNTDWGVLLLFGGGLTLSLVLRETGASAFLAQSIQGMMVGWSFVAVIAGVVLFMIFLTELSSNTASSALLVPIFAVVAVSMELEAAKLVIPLTLAASCAFMLPVATPPNAIVFSSGEVKQKEMMRIGFVLNLAFAGALTLLGWLVFA